jgi:hypothetical protein
VVQVHGYGCSDGVCLYAYMGMHLVAWHAVWGSRGEQGMGRVSEYLVMLGSGVCTYVCACVVYVCAHGGRGRGGHARYTHSTHRGETGICDGEKTKEGTKI